MRLVAVIEKELGETPLQALERFRATDSKLSNIPMTYAGRLDPMATGKLIILIGDECKKKEEYTALDKEYEFEVLFGFESDTGDVLGLAQSFETKAISEKDLTGVAKSCVGSMKAPYPIYSSRTVEGKALFQHAHDETLEAIKIPRADTRVYRMKYLSSYGITHEELFLRIFDKLETLRVEIDPARKGSDFRKEKILERWKSLEEAHRGEFKVARFRTIVSSGTYIRSLAPLIARGQGRAGLAFSIHRTTIGRYRPCGSQFGFWTRTY